MSAYLQAAPCTSSLDSAPGYTYHTQEAFTTAILNLRQGATVKKFSIAALVLLAGCGRQQADVITYVCEEPLEQYLEVAASNIEKDYEVERSTQVLETCPEKGFHRRYTFEFPKNQLLSRQAVDARITATWCNDSTDRTVNAELRISTSTLLFKFNYPWSTATGKYPRTEFLLNRNTLRGGFSEPLDWSCRLQQAEKAPR